MADRPPPNIPLKLAILEARITQRTLGFRAEIPENDISLIARGIKVPTTDEKRRIAKALGKRVSDLFSTETEAVA